MEKVEAWKSESGKLYNRKIDCINQDAEFKMMQNVLSFNINAVSAQDAIKIIVQYSITFEKILKDLMEKIRQTGE